MAAADDSFDSPGHTPTALYYLRRTDNGENSCCIIFHPERTIFNFDWQHATGSGGEKTNTNFYVPDCNASAIFFLRGSRKIAENDRLRATCVVIVPLIVTKGGGGIVSIWYRDPINIQ